MPPRPAFHALYDEAFARYGVRALWSLRRLDNPSAADALVIARALRTQGDRDAALLAAQIEDASRNR